MKMRLRDGLVSIPVSQVRGHRETGVVLVVDVGRRDTPVLALAGLDKTLASDGRIELGWPLVTYSAMAVFQQEEEKEASEEVSKYAEDLPLSFGDPVVAAAFGSVVFSWYQFYIKEDVEHGLFVGLWAPTLLTLASYIQQKDIVQRFKRGVSSL